MIKNIRRYIFNDETTVTILCPKIDGQVAKAIITETVAYAGPGSLAQALGITTGLTGAGLFGDEIWIEEHKLAVEPNEIEIGPTIGIDYAEEDVSLPYRFVLQQKHYQESICDL